MGAKLTKEDIKELTSSSSFDAKEIKEVHKIFVELDADKSGELDRQVKKQRVFIIIVCNY